LLTNRATGRDATVLVHAVKDGTVFADVEHLELADVGEHVVGRDGREKVDVVVAVKLGHFALVCPVRTLQIQSEKRVKISISPFVFVFFAFFFCIIIFFSPCRSVREFFLSYEDFHFLVESVVDQEIVRHANAVRLHRVRLTVIKVADLSCTRIRATEQKKKKKKLRVRRFLSCGIRFGSREGREACGCWSC
jgi:hypothetical protein